MPKIKKTKKTVKKQSSKRTIKKLPTLSLCMIVCDAAQNLDLCLSSVKKVADEIIIVDTGSKDNTVEIAKKYTDKIYHFKWCDDFAKARNASIKHATKDWILVLDDDEILRPESAKILKKFLTNQPKKQNVYTVCIYECTRQEAENELLKKQKSTETYVHTVGRLFRNIKGIKYKNALHEMITEKDGDTIYGSDASLLHWGYSGVNTERFLRNFRIMQKDLAQNPDDILAQFSYTKAYSTMQGYDMTELLCNMDRTIALYLKGGKNLSRMPLSEIYRSYIAILINEKQYTVAEKYCYAWLTRLQDQYDLLPYLTLGKVLFMSDKINDAYRILKLVYEKSLNKIPFCAKQELPKFKSDLYFFYGASCVLEKKDCVLALKLLQTVKQKYIKDNPAIDDLITIAKQYAAENPA